MGYLEDFYKKYTDAKSKYQYNSNIEGDDVFNKAG